MAKLRPPWYVDQICRNPPKSQVHFASKGLAGSSVWWVEISHRSWQRGAPCRRPCKTTSGWAPLRLCTKQHLACTLCSCLQRHVATMTVACITCPAGQAHTCPAGQAQRDGRLQMHSCLICWTLVKTFLGLPGGPNCLTNSMCTCIYL